MPNTSKRQVPKVENPCRRGFVLTYAIHVKPGALLWHLIEMALVATNQQFNLCCKPVSLKILNFYP